MKPTPDEPLLDIALSIADGDPVEWDTFKAGLTAEDRRACDRLRQISALVEAVRTDGGRCEPSQEPRATPPRVPGHWGPFELLACVGSGAYGTVYRARDPHLDRIVALKLIQPGRPPRAERTTVAEGHLLTRVRHPNVVTVFGAGGYAGYTGLWMEFVEGATLEQTVQQHGVLAPGDVCRLGIDLCAALEAVHAAGLIHGDVKAQNLMREDGTGRLVLMDFGAGGHQVSTGDSGRLVGTPAYLAPELLHGGQPSAATDTYAAGAVLYRSVTGALPVPGTTLAELRSRSVEPRTPVRAHRRNVPVALADVIDRAVSADPSERFATATQLRVALERVTSAARWTPRGLLMTAALTILTTVSIWLATSIPGPREDAGPSLHTVWSSPGVEGVHLGSVSYDGRLVSAASADPWGLVVRDLQSGVTRMVVARTAAGSAERSLLSRDGSRIAYGWVTDGRYELREQATGIGQAARVLLRNDQQRFSSLIPCDWSPDGRRLVVAIRRRDAAELVSIDVSEGTTTSLARGWWSQEIRAVHSPDGALVAFNMPAGPGVAQHDIRVTPVAPDGSSPAEALAGSSHDVVAGWSADGRGLLLLSDRTGPQGLWRVNVEAGQPSGDPALLRPDVGGTPVGVTAAGTLMLAVSIVNRDLHIAEVDFETGEVVSAPRRPVPRESGTIGSPTFSPDGARLAYISERLGAEGGTYLVMQDLAGGLRREFLLPVRHLTNVAWAPDGRSLTALSEGGLRRIDMVTGVTTAIEIDGADFQSLRDGRSVFFHAPVNGSRLFVERNTVSGTDRVLIEHEFRIVAAASPDGEYVAALLLGPPSATIPSPRRLMLVARNGEDRRQLLESPDLTMLVRWTPDSRRIVVGTQAGRLAGVSLTGEITWIDLAVAPPVQRNAQLDLHPDGRRIVFMHGAQTAELVALANYQ